MNDKNVTCSDPTEALFTEPITEIHSVLSVGYIVFEVQPPLARSGCPILC